jgi:uncharacterized protein YbjT (DUF2867 family)
MPYKNITILGASGSLGSIILAKIQATRLYNIRVLRRPKSSAIFPPSVDVKDVDLGSLEPLITALQDQDILISCLGTEQVSLQKYLPEACGIAGVHRFIPAEFGADLENPRVRSLPLYAPHVAIREQIFEVAREQGLTYTFVHNGAFLDWGLEHDFLLRLSDYRPILVNGGTQLMSATTLSSVADAVVGILSHPEETRNRGVYVEDMKISQSILFDLVKTVSSQRSWNPAVIMLNELDEHVGKSISSPADENAVLRQFIYQYRDEYRALIEPGYGGNFVVTDNVLFGIKGKNLK